MANDLIEQYFLPTVGVNFLVSRGWTWTCILGSLQITRRWKSDTENVETFANWINQWNIAWWTPNESKLESNIDRSDGITIQWKVFEILSSDKYYGQFKTTPQYLKVLSEIDFTDSLNDNSGWILSLDSHFISHVGSLFLSLSDAVSVSSNNSNEMSVDFTEQQHQLSSNSFPMPNAGVSTGSTTAAVPDLLDNIQNYSITTEINESGTGLLRISRTRIDRSSLHRCLLWKGRKIRHLRYICLL